MERKTFPPLCALLLGIAMTGAAVALHWPENLSKVLVDSAKASDRINGFHRHVWYFFRLNDCRIGSEQISRLNALEAGGNSVTGVLLNAPEDTGEAIRLISAYKSHFKIMADRHDHWKNSILRARYRLPLYAVVESTEFVGGFSPADIISRLAADRSGDDSTVAALRRMLRAAGRRRVSSLDLHTKTLVAAASGILSRPELLATSDSSIYVFDFGDSRLKAFDFSGRKLWEYGNASKGEHPFANPVDLRTDRAGNLVVYDSQARTLVAISGSGKLVRTVRIKTNAYQVIPRSDGSYLVLGGNNKLFGQMLTAAGDTVGDIPLPQRLSGVHAIARPPVVGTLTPSDSLIIGFQHSDELMFLTPRGEPGVSVRGIEPIPTPGSLAWSVRSGVTYERLSPTATPGTSSISISQDRIFVLFGGRTAAAGHLIDTYERATGRYLETYVLPDRVDALAIAHGKLILLRARPGPELSVVDLPRS